MCRLGHKPLIAKGSKRILYDPPGLTPIPSPGSEILLPRLDRVSPPQHDRRVLAPGQTLAALHMRARFQHPLRGEGLSFLASGLGPGEFAGRSVHAREQDVVTLRALRVGEKPYAGLVESGLRSEAEVVCQV